MKLKSVENTTYCYKPLQGHEYNILEDFSLENFEERTKTDSYLFIGSLVDTIY